MACAVHALMRRRTLRPGNGEKYIYKPTSVTIERATQMYDRGALSLEALMSRTGQDYQSFVGYFQFQVTDANWQAVQHLEAEIWDQLKSHLEQGDSWWYAADNTPTAGFGLLAHVRAERIIELTNVLWKS